MATSAFKGSLTQLKIGNGASPEVFTVIGEVTNIGNFGAKSELIEVTHLLSTAKEFIAGLQEGVEVPVTCNFLPTNAQQTLLVAKVVSGTTANFQLLMPAGGSNMKWDFTALVLGWQITTIAPNEAYKLEASLKISGSIYGPF